MRGRSGQPRGENADEPSRSCQRSRRRSRHARHRRLPALRWLLLRVGRRRLLAALGNVAAALQERVQSDELKPTQYLRELFGALPHWVSELLDLFGLVNFSALRRWLNALLRRAVPLAPRHTQELVDRFSTVIRATVRGNFVVAAIQGALGGLAFWALDVGAVLLWTALMLFLALLPAVGAALVWAPVALYFLVSGALWQGWALVAWGVLVIGRADNVLRPMLVGRDTRLPDWLVLPSTLGGNTVMDINGFVLVPAIAAMSVAVWHIRLARSAPP